jgi:hypothetical protein
MITINTSPQLVNPCYNPFYYVVSSSNSSQPNFQYVFDVYTGHTGLVTSADSYVSVSIPPIPVSNNCEFSPAGFLKSLISYDKNVQNITDGTLNKNIIKSFSIYFGEQYGNINTGITVYSGLTVATGVTFGGVLQYDELPSWQFTDYELSGSTSKFLTKQPRSGVYIKNSTDRGSISIMQGLGGSSSCEEFDLVVYHTSGGSTSYTLLNDGDTITGGTDAFYINHLPAGIWNLNNITPGKIIGHTGQTINTDTDYKYTLVCYPHIGGPVSETITFLIDSRDSKYETKRFMFLNSFCCWDYFNFTMISRKTANITRNTFRKVLAYNYSIGDRGETVTDIDGDYSYTVASDYVNQDESNWLFELFKSTEVYVLDSSGNAFPIIIDDSSKEILKTVNDKMLYYQFSYHSAYKIAGQTA